MTRDAIRALSIYAGLTLSGIAVGYFASTHESESGAGVGPIEAIELAEGREDGLSPADVVEAQLRGLQDFATDPTAIARVFAHASPANRSVTGPLPRFARLVRQPPFDVMVGCAGWAVGRPAEKEGVASVLVTVVDREGFATPFRFLLRRQPAELGSPVGRWMTEGVFPALDPTAGTSPTI